MQFLYRHLSPRQLYALGFAIPLACTLAIVYLQWHSVMDMLKTREWVHHTREVQQTLDAFRSSLSDAESCMFRYTITKDEINVDPYNRFLAEADDHFKRLQTLVASNVIQKNYFEQIAPLFTTKRSSMEGIMALVKSGDPAGALQRASAEQHGENMLSLEDIIDKMQHVQADLLWQHQTHFQRDFKIAAGLSVLGMALCFGFIIIILFLMRRLSELQSVVTLCALTEMIEYEGGLITIEEYLQRRNEALTTHGQAQIEAERLLALIERSKLRPMADKIAKKVS